MMGMEQGGGMMGRERREVSRVEAEAEAARRE